MSLVDLWCWFCVMLSVLLVMVLGCLLLGIKWFFISAICILVLLAGVI